MAERLRFVSDALLLSYSGIFFSDSRMLGIFALVSTMVVPGHFLFGMLGAFFASGTAYVVGMDRQSVRRGLFGFNGVLAGLGLSLFYEPTLSLVLALFLISIPLTFVTIFLNNTFNHYLGLPAMSMPFTIITWLALLAGNNTGYLHVPAAKWSVTDMFPGYLSQGLGLFFSNIGAVLFQINALSGFIIAAGVLIYSRIAFLLMTSGFIAAGWIQGFLRADNLQDLKWLGFNHMLAALAIGGVFVVPGPGSFCLALVAAAMSVVILAGTYSLFPDFLSPLALPFNLTVSLVLYGLRSRIYPSMGVHLVAGRIKKPEENLSRYREELRQRQRAGMAISLPFHGRWKVSQGINGKYTHKDAWSFAYDFQAVDSGGNICKSSGAFKEDFFTYGLPVTAPADGRVAAVRYNIPDNPVGKVNTADNWGNYVITEHAPNYYSCISHLKAGSVKVMPWQYVKKGEIIALAGNSGRSPFPHVHIQFQESPNAGAPSLYFDFSNLLALDGEAGFLSREPLKEDSVVQNLSYPAVFESFFPYSMSKIWRYKFKDKVETWTLDADLYGNIFLVSAPKVTRLYFRLSEGVLTIKHQEGRRDTGLSLFGGMVSEMPFPQDSREICWTSTEFADNAVHPFYSMLLNIFSIFGLSLKQNLHCRVKASDSEIHLKTGSGFFLKTPFGKVFLKKEIDSEVIFKKGIGVAWLKSGNKELAIL